MNTNIIINQEYLDYFQYTKDPKTFMYRMAGYFYLFCIISVIPVLLIMHFLEGTVSDSVYTLCGSVMQYAIISIILFALCVGFKTYYFVGFSIPNWKHLVLCIPILFASYIGMSFITTVLSFLTPDMNLSGSVFSYFDVFNLPLTIVIVALVPAIVEELVCRGVIQGICRCRSIVCGIVVSTVCFSLLHMNLQQFSYCFIFGLLLAFVREFTESVWPCLFLHFGSNTISVLVMYQQFKKQTDDVELVIYENLSEYISANVGFSILSIVCCFVCFICMIIMYKFSNHNDFKRVDVEWPPVTAGFVVGWIICILAMLLF